MAVSKHTLRKITDPALVQQPCPAHRPRADDARAGAIAQRNFDGPVS